MVLVVLGQIAACAGIFSYVSFVSAFMRRVEGKTRRTAKEIGVALLLCKALYVIFSAVAIASDPHMTRILILEFTAITFAECGLFLYLYYYNAARRLLRNRPKVRAAEYAVEVYFIAALSALASFLVYLYTFRAQFAIPVAVVGSLLLAARTLLYVRNIREKKDVPMLEKKQITQLTEEAEKAFRCAYAPYSGFSVGAALMAASGKIYRGCNVESATFTPTSCAERSALVSAVGSGERKFLAIAIVGGKDGKIGSACPPCGVCRQFLAEFCGDDFEIYLKGDDGSVQKHTLGEYLPDAFRGDRL